MHPHERVALRQRRAERWRAVLGCPELAQIEPVTAQRVRALVEDVVSQMSGGNRFPADQEEELARLTRRLRATAYEPRVYGIVDTTTTFTAGRGGLGHLARETDFSWGDGSTSVGRGIQTQYARIGWVRCDTPEGAAAVAVLDAIARVMGGASATHEPMPESDTMALPAGRRDDWQAYAAAEMAHARHQMLSL